MIRVHVDGERFDKIRSWLSKLVKPDIGKILTKYGELGVEALAAATPKDTGTTAASWSYEIGESDGHWTVTFNNSNVNNGVNIALILQMGHGTGTGGWVEGIDYINPALAPIFEQFADAAWAEINGKTK